MKYVLSLSLLLCICLLGCKSQDTSQKSSSTEATTFVGTTWVLTKLNGDLVNLDSPELEQPYLTLNENDNSVGGNGGCNGFGGTYTLEDDQTIAFSQLLSTLKHCEDRGIEAVFMSNLEKAKKYILLDNELTFKDENGYVLATFEPSVNKK